MLSTFQPVVQSCHPFIIVVSRKYDLEGIITLQCSWSIGEQNQRWKSHQKDTDQCSHLRRFLCLTTTFVLLILIVVLFCADMPFVIASNSKVDDGNENRYTLCYSTSEIDRLLSNNCVNFRKRAMWKSGENILQSPEKAQRFLQKRITYVTNYGLFLEECCHESSCRVEEILEHCAAPV